MPFKSDTYRILIASPSDLAEERDAATEVLNEWNVLHAATEGAVLLPVRWETHATPQSGVRPQAAINVELVAESDMLIGMFWTKLGTSTGVAVSGTVEEIDQFVAAGKPAMLYFSSRPIDPGKIDLEQQGKLREFKEETYKTALVGGFSSVAELRTTVMADITRQVRKVRGRRRGRRNSKLDEAERLVNMLMSFQRANITPEQFHQFRDELLAPKVAKAAPHAPLEPGEKGPNGYRVGYDKNGDLVEWLPDEENEGQEWPMILRRNDNDIGRAVEEFETVVWYDRKLVMLKRIEAGQEKMPPPDIEKGMREAMAAAEKKYGKRKIRQYYEDDFGWGMLNGKLSALRWVLGDEWDMLDT